MTLPWSTDVSETVMAITGIMQILATLVIIYVALWTPRYQQRVVQESREPLVRFVGGQAHQKGYTEIIYRNYGVDPAKDLKIKWFVVVVDKKAHPSFVINSEGSDIYSQPLAHDQWGTLVIHSGLEPQKMYAVVY